LLSQMITLNESNLVIRSNLANFAQPAYPYRFSLHSSVPGNASPANPIQIAFTGQMSDVLVDEKTVPADATQAFVKRAISAFRTGTLPQFLALWTDYDAKGVFARNLQTNTIIRGNPKAPFVPLYKIGRDWNRVQVHLVFTIDLGIESLVFLRTSDEEELQLMLIWKQNPDDYRLSESGALEKGDAIPGNLLPLFYSSAFQSYLNGRVNKSIQEP
jgi:hypothetical protein